jgi:hypothetical protein
VPGSPPRARNADAGPAGTRAARDTPAFRSVSSRASPPAHAEGDLVGFGRGACQVVTRAEHAPAGEARLQAQVRGEVGDLGGRQPRAPAPTRRTRAKASSRGGGRCAVGRRSPRRGHGSARRRATADQRHQRSGRRARPRRSSVCLARSPEGASAAPDDIHAAWAIDAARSREARQIPELPDAETPRRSGGRAGRSSSARRRGGGTPHSPTAASGPQEEQAPRHRGSGGARRGAGSDGTYEGHGVILRSGARRRARRRRARATVNAGICAARLTFPRAA